MYFQFALVSLIALLAFVSGKPLYALRGIAVYAVICAFTVWCMGVMSGTWRTMFVAFLGLVHKVYACGMLSGIVIATTKVGEFLSAMTRLHVPKKHAMRLRDVFPTVLGFLKAPAMTVNCIYVPILTAASKAADELSIASVTRGIENPRRRTCLVCIRMRTADWLVILLFTAFLAAELLYKAVAV